MLADLIGYVEEVQEAARVCSDAINRTGVKTVVVLDSYHQFIFQRLIIKLYFPRQQNVEIFKRNGAIVFQVQCTQRINIGRSSSQPVNTGKIMIQNGRHQAFPLVVFSTYNLE